MRMTDTALLGRHSSHPNLPDAKGTPADPTADRHDDAARLSSTRANSLAAGPSLRILFVALSNDIGSERVIGAMSRCGVECAVVSPSSFFCTQTHATQRHFPIPHHYGFWYGTLFVRRRLEQALRVWSPRLIMALDDQAARLLRGLAVDPRVSLELRKILVESLGAPEGYFASVDRRACMDLAARLGINKPAHCEDTTVEAATAAAELWGYPVVVKNENTCGGKGVAIVRDPTALMAKLPQQSIAAWPRRLKLLAKRALFSLAGFGPSPVFACMLQSFVPGVPAFRTLAAWKGHVIAGVSFAVEQTHPGAVGASTIIRHVENDEMDRACAAMTSALGCSGFVSFDFMLDRETGRAALIEMNPRSVGSTHLGALFGHDICAAFVAKVTGGPQPDTRPATSAPAIALFPKELERDPNSPYLKRPDVFHDVPVNDPALLEAYTRWLATVHSAPTQASDGA